MIRILLYIVLLCPNLIFAQVDLHKKIADYVDEFNAQDNEAVVNLIPNQAAAAWMQANIPRLDCPDADIEQMYYFRWWSYRKHIKATPEGTIVTEFIEPVKHAGKYNSISCALGHHLYEGRWLKNNAFLKEYVDFWLFHADKDQSKPRFHQFSSWLPDALLAYYHVNGDKSYLLDRLDALDADYQTWEKERQLEGGLFWQHDVKDGMEESVSGARREENRRPTINSYMYGNASALAEMAALAGRNDLQEKYSAKAKTLKQLLVDSLWDQDEHFFKTRLAKGGLHPAREAIGFIPWYFHAAPDQATYAVAWKQAIDTAGFNAPWGQTTAERREPTFRTRGTGHSCEWDGAIWPFATSQTLRGMANLLVDYKHKGGITPKDFFAEVQQYAKAQVMNGKPYIGEYQDETNGQWLKGDDPRSKFYNHSTFADVIIQDLLGFKPSGNKAFSIKPLIPAGEWAYFCLAEIPYNGKTIAIFWDVDGRRYGKGKGLTIYADGKLVARSKKLKPLNINLK